MKAGGSLAHTLGLGHARRHQRLFHGSFHRKSHNFLPFAAIENVKIFRAKIPDGVSSIVPHDHRN